MANRVEIAQRGNYGNLCTLNLLRKNSVKTTIFINKFAWFDEIIFFQVWVKFLFFRTLYLHNANENDYRPGQANYKFQLSMLNEKSTIFVQFCSNFQGLTHPISLKVWAKMHENCGLFTNSIESWNFQLACPGL